MEPRASRPDDDYAALTTLWRDRGVVLAEAADGSQSLAASDRALTTGMTESAGGLRLDETTRATLAREPLELGALLGRGGQGIVQVAEQRSLRREVAVKRLADHADESGLASLLKEAWVGGLLAHPNVAPVHALVELDGQPAVVMKRIAGRSWREVMRDPALLPEGEHGDPLAFHLRVLVAVCNAVHHAHQRGVLHLDLKPENVMLGRFGEICVVDWGLSASFGPEAPPWMPRADAIRSVAGTPDYMAPEIASVAAEEISPRTDVYLLGAVLHEIVTGRAPHRGGTAIDRMMRAYRSEPQTYPKETPAGLVSILHRAMSRAPEDRFPSVEALRDAIEQFTRERRAEERIAEARLRVGSLELAVDEAAGEIEIARAFGAARFALAEAESARPDHEGKAALHERMHVAMARSALAAGDIPVAESHLAQLADTPEELAARLRELRERAAERTRRVRSLESLAKEADLDEGSRFRRLVLLFFSLVLLVGNVVFGLADRAGVVPHSYGAMIVQGFAIMAAVGAYVWSQRRALFRNHANGVLFGVAILSFLSMQSLWGVLWMLGVPFERGALVVGVAYLLAGGGVTTLVSLRFVPSVLFAGVALVLAPIFPAHAWTILGVGSGLALATVGLAWPLERRQAA
ncbi:MAG: serine/threonine-protein kinase [Sandaracinus sp.]